MIRCLILNVDTSLAMLLDVIEPRKPSWKKPGQAREDELVATGSAETTTTGEYVKDGSVRQDPRQLSKWYYQLRLASNEIKSSS